MGNIASAIWKVTIKGKSRYPGTFHKDIKFPVTIEQFEADGPEGLTKLLRAGNFIADHESVESFTASNIGEGISALNSASKVLEVKFSGNVEAPTKYFVKFAPIETIKRITMELFRLGASEASFYNELQSNLSVKTPNCAFADHSEQSGCVLVILEFVTNASTLKVDIKELPLSQAEKMIDIYAEIHSSCFCDKAEAQQKYPWMNLLDAERNKLVNKALKDAWPKVKNHAVKAGLEFPSGFDEIKNELCKNMYNLCVDTYKTDYIGICHGDGKPDNWLLYDDGTVGLMDWQLVSHGCIMADLMYFFAMFPENLWETHLDALLQRHYKTLEDKGLFKNGQTYEEYRELFNLNLTSPMVVVWFAIKDATPAQLSDETQFAQLTLLLSRVFKLWKAVNFESLFQKYLKKELIFQKRATESK